MRGGSIDRESRLNCREDRRGRQIGRLARSMAEPRNQTTAPGSPGRLGHGGGGCLGNLVRSDDSISSGFGFGQHNVSNLDDWESLWMHLPAISY